MKRNFLLTILLMIAVASLSSALTKYFYADEKRTITVGKSEFYRVTSHAFAVNTTCRPNESFPVDLALTSDASIPMYVWLLIEMPTFDGKGLYKFDLNPGWVLQEEGITSGSKYFCAYRYEEPLAAEETTLTSLTDEFTMRDMSKKEYGTYTNVSFAIRAFSSGTDGGTDVEIAWQNIRSDYSWAF